MTRPPRGGHPVGFRQVQVLGWVIDGDVTRDHAFVYRAIGRTSDVDDAIYELEQFTLVTLSSDGCVRATPAGKQLWHDRRPKRGGTEPWRAPQFAAGHSPSS